MSEVSTVQEAKIEAMAKVGVDIIGDPELFKLLNRENRAAYSITHEAMCVGTGCVLQTTRQQGDNVVQTLTFVPGVQIADDINGGRKLVPSTGGCCKE